MKDVAMIKHEERRWQNEQGGDLQQQAYSRPGTRIVLDRQHARIAKALQICPGMRVLDLGCGVGYFLAFLKKYATAEYYGLDLSQTSLKSAHMNDFDTGFTVGDAELLPYRNAMFDRVSCNGAAHHFVDEHSAFREIHRVLAPGGRLVLHEPVASSVTTALRGLVLRTDKYESPADLAHKEAFTSERASKVLTEVGFTDVTASLYDFLAYPISGNYMRSPLSRARVLMNLLCRLEDSLERIGKLRQLLQLVAWRVLIVATKSRSYSGSAPGNNIKNNGVEN